MTTIDERAYNYYPKADIVDGTGYYAYVKGATEQRDIDIEKATEWLNANWRKYIDTDADNMIRFSGWKNDFRKAMTEQNG